MLLSHIHSLRRCYVRRESVWLLFLIETVLDIGFGRSVGRVEDCLITDIVFLQIFVGVEMRLSLFTVTSCLEIGSWIRAINCTPVTVHETVEAHELSQITPESVFIGTRIHMIDFIVAAHYRCNTSLHGGFKRWVVNFPKSSLINVGTHAVSIDFLVICNKMLDVCKYWLTLHSSHLL